MAGRGIECRIDVVKGKGMRRWRGMLRLVLLSLGLGVVTTYGVAWGLMNRRIASMFPISLSRVTMSSWPSEGWRMAMEVHGGVAWAQSTPLNDDAVGLVLYDVSRAGSSSVVPSWSIVNRVSPNSMLRESATSRTIWERAAGWPRLAIVERQIPRDDWDRYDTREYGWSIRIGGHNRQLWSGTVFAFTPIWEGFAVDLAMFGAGWFVVIGGVQFIARRRRMAAGHCPRCQYDLSGLTGGVCPECGSALKGM